MYRQVPDALKLTLSSQLDLSKSRLETLALLILGLINGRTVNLSHVASQLSGSALIKSGYRRLQRFFQFVQLDGDWLAQLTVKRLAFKPPWVLCLDRTNWKVGRRDVNILMLAIATRRIRIPLMWTMLDKSGASSQGERIELMQRYLAVFGPGSIGWLLADREFIGAEWMKFLLENNILFVIRVKESHYISHDDGRSYQLKSLLRTRKNARRLLARPGRLAAMIDGPGMPLTFAAKRLRDGELLIVATNGPTNKALDAYKKRWQVECLFGDSKTRGLNMEDTRLTDPAKLDTLLIVITLAMTWAYNTATAAHGGGAIKKRAHGYRYKSWFRIGFDLVRNWILHQPDNAAASWKRAWPMRKITPTTPRVVECGRHYLRHRNQPCGKRAY
jgi:hypothetical protein